MRLKETTLTELEQQLLGRLEILFCKDGYQIVELNYITLKGRAHFNMVLFHSAGLSLDSCSDLHKITDVEIERLQAAGFQISDYSLELSSPGLGRRLRTRREFEVFCGQKVRCMIDNRWQHGLLRGLEENAENGLCVCLEQAPEEQVLCLPLEQALKIELDS